MSRGLGGHSMGGYGTIRIGMKRPGVFSSLYIMSACCLLNNGGGGRGNRAAAAPAETPEQGARGQRAGGRGAGFANAGSAQAAAWASNPNNSPQFFDLPVKDGVPQPLIVAKYAANSPLVMIDQYVTNLKKYHAIMGEVGTQDTLAPSNKQMDQILTDFGVKHTFETYEGDHTNRVKERFELKGPAVFLKKFVVLANVAERHSAAVCAKIKDRKPVHRIAKTREDSHTQSLLGRGGIREVHSIIFELCGYLCIVDHTRHAGRARSSDQYPGGYRHQRTHDRQYQFRSESCGGDISRIDRSSDSHRKPDYRAAGCDCLCEAGRRQLRGPFARSQ